MDANSSKNGIKFHYFYDRHNSNKRLSRGHGGIVTVMTVLDKDTQMLKISFAYCSPKDIFNKKISHKICDGRLKDGSYTTVPFTGNSFIDTANFFNNKLDAKVKPKFCQKWNINSDTGDIFF